MTKAKAKANKSAAKGAGAGAGAEGRPPLLLGAVAIAVAVAAAVANFGGGMQPKSMHAEPPTPTPPTSTVQIERGADGVLEVQWRLGGDAQALVDAVQAQVEPVVIRNSPCKEWKAAALWNAEYLSSKLPTLHGVRRKKEGVTGSRFINEVLSDMGKLAQKAGVQAERQEEDLNVSSAEFFARDTPEYFSQSILDPELAAVRPDVGSYQQFSVHDGLEDSFLWMAKGGIRAAMHYDTAANFNCQIVGNKRFVVGDPSLWRLAKLHPSFHLSGRQSQEDITWRAIRLRKQELGAFKAVTLGPGEALYIPPYYLHAVETLDTCVNVNFFSASPLRAAEKELLTSTFIRPAVLRDVFKADKLAYPAAVSHFLLTMVVELKRALAARCGAPQAELFSQRDAKSLLHDITVSQYTPLAAQLGCDDWSPERCPSFDVPLGKTAVEEMEALAKRAAGLIFRRDDLQWCERQPVLDIFLANWAEGVAFSAIGFAKGCSFLRCVATLANTNQL